MSGLMAALVFAATAQGAEPVRAAVTDEVRTVSAQFSMKRRFAGSDAEMSIIGSMALEKGRRLKWRTDKPVGSVTVISSDGISTWDALTDRWMERKATDMPWLKTVFSCQNALLSGDFDRAEGFAVERRKDGWIVATPATPELAALFSRMEVRFSEDGRLAQKVMMVESGGDATIIEFSQVKINEVLPEGEWKAH